MGIAHAERDLNLHEVVLRNWVSELAADPQRAFPGLEISPRYWEYNRAGRVRGSAHPKETFALNSKVDSC
jgi:hypothetical protein